MSQSSSPRIIFMGTPQFAVPSLNKICEAGYIPQAVVTSPDKISGRGLKLNSSPVKQFADEHGIKVFQPDNLDDEQFISEIKNLHPDIIIVVAFRKLPPILLEIPSLISFNLHASLLPQYRGAAPINHAIINGETETGNTTFILDNKIDTGKILLQTKVNIPQNLTASELHDIMMNDGAKLVMDTVNYILSGNYKTIDQKNLIKTDIQLKKAPKIFKNDCNINWNNSCENIRNFVRGLCYSPGAFTELLTPDGTINILKIYKTETDISSHNVKNGVLETDGISYIRISNIDGYVYLKEIQLAGRKKMSVIDFLRGNSINNHWKIRNSL